MRPAAAAILAACVAFGALAEDYVNVVVRTTDFGLGQLVGTNVTMTPVGPVRRTYGTNLVTLTARTLATDTDGVATFTNTLWGKYDLTVPGTTPTTWRLNLGTNHTTSVSAATLVTDPASYPPDPATNYYTMPQVDALVANSAGQIGTNAPTLWYDAGTEIYPSGVVGTNNGWLASGGNLYPQQTAAALNLVPNPAVPGGLGTSSNAFTSIYGSNVYSWVNGAWARLTNGAGGGAVNDFTITAGLSTNDFLGATSNAVSATGAEHATNFWGVLDNTNLPTAMVVGTVGGNGYPLTNLNASMLATGTVPLARLSGITSNQFDAGTSNLLALAGTGSGIPGVLTNPVIELGTGKRLEFTNSGTMSSLVFSPVTAPTERQGIFFSGATAGDGSIWYWPNHGGDSMTAPELLFLSRGSMAFSTGNLGGGASGAASRGFQFGIGGAWHNWMYMQADAPGSTLIDGGNTNYAMSIPVLFKAQYWSNSAWGVIGSSGSDTLTGSYMPGMVGRATGTNGDGAISFYDRFCTGYGTWGSSEDPRFEVRVSPDTARGGISINGGIVINGATGLTTNYPMSDGNTCCYSNGLLVAIVPTPPYWNAAATNYLARINTALTESLATNINSFVKSLAADGTWTNLQALYTFSGADASTNGQNLISTAHTIVWSGTWGTNNATGIHGNGSDAYGNTTFTNAATNGSAFVYVKANANGGGDVLFGVQVDGGTSAKKIYLLDQNAAYGLGTFSSYASATVWYPTWPSSVMLQRSGTANVDYYTGGSVTATSTATAVTGMPDSRAVYVGCLHNQGSPALYSAAHIQGLALTTNVLSGSQYKTLHDAFVTLNTALGR